MRIALIVLLLLIFKQAIAQPEIVNDPYLKFDHLSKEDGLSHNFVLDIFQDKYGFIWIATKDGLNKYNASNFEIYRHNPEDTLSISDDLITSIAQDNYGTLWIGTKNGLNTYNYENNTFHRCFTGDHSDSKLQDNFIRELYPDDQGILWIETASGCLHKYDIRNGKLYKYRHRKPEMTNTYFYHKIYEDKKGNLWLGGRNMGIYKFRPETGHLEEILADPNDPDKKRERDVATYFTDSKGTFWISGVDGLYTYKEGKGIFNKLLKSSTYSVSEDSSGRLWFGTGSGIFVYNRTSNTFTSHIHSENNPNSLIADHVNKILIDKSGNVWAGTTEGISIYSPTKNKFRHIYHISGNNNTPSSNYITSILQSENGKIWIGTAKNGLDCFDSHFIKTSHLGEYEEKEHKLTSDKISVLYEDRDKDIWVGLWSGKGFNIIYQDRNSIGSYEILDNSLRADWYSGFLHDQHNNSWIATWGAAGLYLFDKELGDFKDETFYNWTISTMAGILDIVPDNELIWITPNLTCFVAYNKSKNKYNGYFEENNLWTVFSRVNQVFRDSDNEIWFGTNKGLYRKTREPYNIFRPYRHSTDKLSLTADNILAIGNAVNKNKLWIVSGEGIELFNKSDQTYTLVCDHIFTGSTIHFVFEDNNKNLWTGTSAGLYKLKSQNTIPEKIVLPLISPAADTVAVYCYQAGNDGSLVFGTSSGLYYYDIKNKSFLRQELLTDYKIYSMARDKPGNLWIGTNMGLYNTKGNKITQSFKATASLNSLPADSVYSLTFDHPDDLWIGTNKGLCMLDLERGEIRQHNSPDIKYLSSRLTRCISEDSRGNIWIGTSDMGLNKLNPKTGIITRFFSDMKDSAAIWSDGITCILEDQNKNIWIGAYGLNKYIPESNTFEHYTVTNGLADNHVMGILEDNSGKLWISTQNGLSRFDPSTGTFNNYFSGDGLQDNEFTEACFKLQDNRLVFGGKNGLNLIDPEKIKTNTHPPEVSITKFLVFDDEYPATYSQSRPITLKHNQNYFSFEFSAHDYSNPQKNRFAYKLEGFDPDWFFTDASDNKARYTNVAPGEYVFRIKAANNDGVWGDTVSGIDLIINPPFWKTAWFISIEIALIVALVIAYIKYREKKIHDRNKLLLMEQKLLRSQMNPHFIFNSLTSIQSFIFENNPIEAGSYLSRFSELIRSILYNSREEFISLEKEINTLNNYLDIQQLRYNNKFEYSIEIDPKIDTEMQAIPPMLAQPFIENSIEHGIKHLNGGGWIHISYSLSNDTLILKIEDNGIGIEASKKLKDKKASEHKSLAMVITKERIDILNNRKGSVKYSLKVEDIFDSGKVSGTSVTFTIPVLKLNFENRV